MSLNEFLGRAELFQGLADDAIETVVRVASLRQYSSDADILVEGDTGEFLYIIHKGSVRVSKRLPRGGEEALVVLGTGGFFGEIEFFHPGKGCAAHVVAHTDCELISVPHIELRELMQADSQLSLRLLWGFGRSMAARIRATNDRMGALLSITDTFG